MTRVVVVGGGLAGSAAAARLARLGHDVTLVEALPRLGGALGSLTKDGYRWDAGPSSTALPAVLRDLFRKTGRPLERALELVPEQPMREHRFGDGTRLALPSGSRAAQMEAVDSSLGPGLGRQWVDHVHRHAETWDALRRDFLERPYSSEVASPAATALLQSRRGLLRAVRSLKDRRLQTLATHHAVQGGHHPSTVPAWYGLLDYVEQNFGTWTVPGGLGVLAGVLTERLGERGVRVLLSTAAHDIRMGPDSPQSVDTSAGALPCETVVVAVDPRSLPALAPYVARTAPAPPPAVTHLGLSSPVPDIPGEVVLHGDRDGDVITVRTRGTAPLGKAAWTLLSRGRVTEDPVAALAGRGIDVRDLVEVRVDVTPEGTVERYSGSPYGVRWQGRRTLRDRVGPRTPLPGVYAVGAHTGGGGWLPFVGLTAAVVADLIGREGTRGRQGSL